MDGVVVLRAFLLCVASSPVEGFRAGCAVLFLPPRWRDAIGLTRWSGREDKARGEGVSKGILVVVTAEGFQLVHAPAGARARSHLHGV
eukprot:1870301-Prymnesium_polylepis.2